jgi:hypothetical protein
MSPAPGISSCRRWVPASRAAARGCAWATVACPGCGSPHGRVDVPYILNAPSIMPAAFLSVNPLSPRSRAHVCWLAWCFVADNDETGGIFFAKRSRPRGMTRLSDAQATPRLERSPVPSVSTEGLAGWLFLWRWLPPHSIINEYL